MGKPKSDDYLEASRIVKAELARQGITYKELAKLVPGETYVQLKTKINRGSFSAAFFIKVMRAIGVEYVDLRASRSAPDAGRVRP